MAVNVVEVSDLSKRYKLGGHPAAYATLRETVAALATRRGTTGRHVEDLWALRDIDLTVPEGEILGIVGRNGAGKTTLLKILARITEPTTGVARVRGRLGALLEVGTGFHPELTGRENIHLNGAILGMSRREIRARFDTIVEFAGVQRFIDTPLKRYSTGMELRLAFAVAAHFEPDVVLVDEVLAVGDIEFQRRCLGKMSDLTEAGRTVLFVSHDLGALGRLCSRAIWIDRGRIASDGDAADVLDRYLSAVVTESTSVDLGGRRHGPIRLLGARVHCEEPAGDGRLLRDKPLLVKVRLVLEETLAGLDLNLGILDSHGTVVLNESWSDTGRPMVPAGEQGEYEASMRIPPVLVSGTYRLRLWLGTAHETFVLEPVLTFEVVPRHDDTTYSISRSRIVQPGVEWSLNKLSGPEPAPGATVGGSSKSAAGQ